MKCVNCNNLRNALKQANTLLKAERSLNTDINSDREYLKGENLALEKQVEELKKDRDKWETQAAGNYEAFLAAHKERRYD